MDRIHLSAEERIIFGKKVKKLRRNGIIPAHVFGKKQETEHVSVISKDFLPVLQKAGETGLIDLKIGSDKIRPVLIRGVQYDPVHAAPLHIDFYQVNLLEKVTVPVPIVIVGEEPEKVHIQEAVVLQTVNEVEVEGLPTDLIEKIEVDISTLKEIDDAITVGQLQIDRSKLTVLADEEEVVVKLAPSVTAEMEQILAEQEAEAQATVETVTAEEPEEQEVEATKIEGTEAPKEQKEASS